MARPKKAAATLDNATGVDTEALDNLGKQQGRQIAEREAHLALVDIDYTPERPYDLPFCTARLISLREDTGRRLLEMGQLLLLVREHENRDTYARILDETGITERFARRTMQAAIKFGATDARKFLASQIGSAKLLELLAEDESEIDALKDGGTIAGLNIDDIERMTTRELRETLRNERQEIAARDEIIARKDKKLRDLELKHRRGAKTPTREKAEDVMKLIAERAGEHMAATESLRLAIAEVYAVYEEAGESIDADIDKQLEFFAQGVMNGARQIADSVGV